VQIREIRDLDSLAAIRKPWQDMLDRSAWDSPYLTPGFLVPWIRLTGDTYGMRVLTAWQDELLLGLAPLFDRKVGPAPLSLHRRSFPIFGQSPPLDIVIVDRPEEVMGAFAAHWAADSRWELLELRDLPADSPTPRLLAGVSERLPFRLRTAGERWTDCVSIHGTWEEYLAGCSRKLRRTYKQQRNRCQRAGPTRFLRHPGDVGYDDALQRAGDVIRRSWKSSGSEDPRLRTFLSEVTAEARDAGRLRMRFLEVAGSTIASLIEFEYKSALHAYHVAYDLGWQPLGAGFLTIGDGVRQSHELGYRRYDFGNSTPQTRSWANDGSSFRSLELFRGGLAGTKTKLYRQLRERKEARVARQAERERATRMRESR
jgi:CelD/BcsL family acetyltransferase involved in cellulose biosynthesis